MRACWRHEALMRRPRGGTSLSVLIYLHALYDILSAHFRSANATSTPIAASASRHVLAIVHPDAKATASSTHLSVDLCPTWGRHSLLWAH